MKSFASVIPALGFVAAASAQYYNATAYTTETVTSFTTYCPEATTFTYGTKTYTATASEVITVTDCPCTISKPVYTTLPTKPTVPTAPVYVTLTVSEYTTYCPAPTHISIAPNSTITVTEATSLTVTDCPCTLTKPGVVTTTVSYLTTYCPAPTTIIVGNQTYPVTTPGTVTVPVSSVTTVPAEETTYAPSTAPVATTPVATTPVGTGSPVAPTATPSGPIEANSGAKIASSFGAVFAAGLVALVL